MANFASRIPRCFASILAMREKEREKKIGTFGVCQKEKGLLVMCGLERRKMESVRFRGLKT